MIRSSLLFVVFFLIGATVRSEEPAIAKPAIRAAIEKSLPLLMTGAVGHRENRTCFACHQQGPPIFALTAARAQGFPIDEDELGKQLAFITKFLDGNRPPSEAGSFTTTYMALYGLSSYGTSDQQERIAARTAQVRDWLIKTPAKDNEDRVFRLWALDAASAPAAEIAAAAQELLSKQRDDGGWAQLDSGEPAGATESDAYATGTALVALQETGGLSTSDPAYQKGVAYLLKAQLDDGSWHVVSRSKPFQPYYESGFPHGKDQFISCAASGWATWALVKACNP